MGFQLSLSSQNVFVGLFTDLNDYERGLSVVNVLSLKTRHFPQNVLLLIPISLIIIQIFEKLGVRLPTLFERDRKCTKKY